MSQSNQRDFAEPDIGEIWLLLDSLTFGGIETHVVELALGLKTFEQPVRVVLLTEFDRPSAIVGKLSALELNYCYLHQLSDAPSSKGFMSLLKQCRHACLRYQPKVIHAHGYKANLVSKLSSGTTRQVSTFHSGETPKGLVRLYDLFDRFSAFLSAHNFTVSQAISDKIPTQTHVLNNFISVDGLTSSQGKQVAFVGRLSHEKGPDLFISVAEQLPQITFHLYGDGPMMQSLGHDSPSNLVFHGFQSDMRKVWPEIGLLLITSRYEGLPMTALEAMARGIPVISTRVGAIESLISDKQNGWVANSIDDFPTLIQQWFELDNQLRLKIVHSAESTITSHYSTQAVIPQIIDSYR